MPLLAPFCALAPPASLAQALAAPPYDVVSSAEARRLAAGRPQSFFRISRPEVDFPPEVDEHAPAVYARGADNLRLFRKEGWLREDASPGFRLYRQKMGEHVQTGVVACAALDGYRDGAIKRHELTRADKEDDRTQHIDALSANDEPVFLTYRARDGLDVLVESLTSGAPDVDFTSEDGVRHTVWRAIGRDAVRLATELGRLRRRGCASCGAHADNPRAKPTGFWRSSFLTTRCRFCPTTAWCETWPGAAAKPSSPRCVSTSTSTQPSGPRLVMRTENGLPVRGMVGVYRGAEASSVPISLASSACCGGAR